MPQPTVKLVKITKRRNSAAPQPITRKRPMTINAIETTSACERRYVYEVSVWWFCFYGHVYWVLIKRHESDEFHFFSLPDCKARCSHALSKFALTMAILSLKKPAVKTFHMYECAPAQNRGVNCLLRCGQHPFVRHCIVWQTRCWCKKGNSWKLRIKFTAESSIQWVRGMSSPDCFCVYIESFQCSVCAHRMCWSRWLPDSFQYPGKWAEGYTMPWWCLPKPAQTTGNVREKPHNVREKPLEFCFEWHCDHHASHHNSLRVISMSDMLITVTSMRPPSLSTQLISHYLDSIECPRWNCSPRSSCYTEIFGSKTTCGSRTFNCTFETSGAVTKRSTRPPGVLGRVREAGGVGFPTANRAGEGGPFIRPPKPGGLTGADMPSIEWMAKQELWDLTNLPLPRFLSKSPWKSQNPNLMPMIKAQFRWGKEILVEPRRSVFLMPKFDKLQQ